MSESTTRYSTNLASRRNGRMIRINFLLPFVTLIFVTLLVLSACTTAPNAATGLASLATPPYNGAIESVLNYTVAFPTPTPVPTDSALPTPTRAAEEEKQFAVVSTSNARANIRQTASTDGTIIGKGNPGDAFEVVGRTNDGQWFQVCCVEGTEQRGWVAASVVRITNDANVPIVAISSSESTTQTVDTALLKNDLKAEWQVNWNCGSDRCTIKQCGAKVNALITRPSTGQFLPIEHNVTWDKACFSTDNWVFEVDRTNGRERTGEYEDNFLYGYWLGANPGDTSGVFPLEGSDRGVLVHCTGPTSVEIAEGGGWTSSYEGTTCHDLRTGMLVYMSYTKRWLFSGEFDGQSYDQAFFGDTETLEQKLVDTNLELSYVQKIK